MGTDWLMATIAYLGVGAAAVSGVVEARRHEMDIVGAVAVALITALGGGTIRDLLLGRTPVFWIVEEAYAILALVVAVFTFYSTRLLTLTSRSILIPDALGLGMFSILGAGFGLQSGTSLFIASLMGVITGVFGGILRDVLCNQIPVVFARSTTLYATCSLAGSWVYILLIYYHISGPVASIIGIAVVVTIRLIAVRYNLRLPDPA